MPEAQSAAVVVPVDRGADKGQDKPAAGRGKREGAAAEPCLIGQRSTVRGQIAGDEDVTVQGRVEGQIALSRRLVVESGGTVEADCEVAELQVAGELRGDVAAQKVISLAAGAQVSGTLRAPRIIIEDGARFSGAIEMDVDLPDGVELPAGRS
jgi:cytoskeletal protein CcmA (bactofilin family)